MSNEILSPLLRLPNIGYLKEEEWCQSIRPRQGNQPAVPCSVHIELGFRQAVMDRHGIFLRFTMRIAQIVGRYQVLEKSKNRLRSILQAAVDLMVSRRRNNDLHARILHQRSDFDDKRVGDR